MSKKKIVKAKPLLMSVRAPAYVSSEDVFVLGLDAKLKVCGDGVEELNRRCNGLVGVMDDLKHECDSKVSMRSITDFKEAYNRSCSVSACLYGIGLAVGLGLTPLGLAGMVVGALAGATYFAAVIVR